MLTSFTYLDYILTILIIICIIIGVFRIMKLFSNYVLSTFNPNRFKEQNSLNNEILNLIEMSKISSNDISGNITFFEILRNMYNSKINLFLANEKTTMLKNRKYKQKYKSEISELILKFDNLITTKVASYSKEEILKLKNSDF